MFRDDTDAILTWITKEGDPAILLDYWSIDPATTYVVALMGIDGKMITQTFYTNIKQALRAYADLLPEGGDNGNV
jgi:hypothetical protein